MVDFSGPIWSDIIPLPVPSFEPEPLAQIAYPDAYVEATSYLRAVMAANEQSERVLELTEMVIKMNPAHYTVWLYRAQTLIALKADLQHELDSFLNPVSLRFLKNYQIWHHRQTILTHMPASPALFASEAAFLKDMFAKDSKNYHVWSYRTWLVRHYGLWDDPQEWSFVEAMIEDDVRNNSAWSFRWFLNFTRRDDDADEQNPPALEQPHIISKEVEYVRAKIALAPQNQSPWNYLRGLLTQSVSPAKPDETEIINLANEYVNCHNGSLPKSSHAMDLLAHIYTKSDDQSVRAEAVRLLDLLATEYDPVRSGYWNWRKAAILGCTPA